MIEELHNENMLIDIISEVATRTSVARRIVRSTALPNKVSEVKATADTAQTTANTAIQAAKDAGGVTNDNVAPTIPSGITATVFEHNLSISWVPAVSSEYVVKTRVRITPAGGTSFIRTTTDTYYIAVELTPNVIHDVEIQFEDRWGLTSGWSAPVQATPEPLIAEQIAASVQVAAAQISGQLGNDQIAQITNPAKLAETVYSTAVERGGRGANLLVFDRAEGAAYNVGPWPQKGYTATFAGRDISIISHMGDLWWQSVTDAADTVGSASFFWNGMVDMGLQGDTYIYSAMVKNTGTADASVRVAVDQAMDAAGTGLLNIQGSAVTIPADGKIYRIFVRWTNDKTRPFKRFWQSNRLASSTTLWNKFQLEEAGADQLGPGRYTIPVMNAGALSARLLAAWDLTAVRAIVGDLTVESAKITDGAIVTAKISDASITTAKIMDAQITSAKINSLVADKITTGTLAATTITLGTGGSIRAGVAGAGTSFDAGGVTLDLATSYDTKAFAAARKITGVGDFASFMVYKNIDPVNEGYFKGVVIRSDGEGTASTNFRGAVVLHATPAGAINAQSARLHLTALAGTTGRGDCAIFADTGITGNLNVHFNTEVQGTIGSVGGFKPQSVLASTAVAAGTSLTVTHNLGTYPAIIQAYLFNAVSTDNIDGIAALPTRNHTMYVWDNTTAAFKIYNGNTGSRNVIARVFK